MASTKKAWSWLAPGAWDEIVAASPAATGFHSRGWIEAMAAHSGKYRPAALGLALPDGGSVLFPMLVRSGALRRGMFARAVSSYPNVYGGPLHPERLLDPDDWRAVLDGLERGPIGRIECFDNVLQPIPAELAEGRTSYDDVTHVLELGALQGPARDAYRSSARRAVKRAEREGVAVERAATASDFEQYDAIYRESLARWGKDAGAGYPAALLRSLAELPGVELWVARDAEGRVASGGLFLFSRAHAVYWQGAMRSDATELRPSNALHDAVIEEARRRGCALYDFNPSAGLDNVQRFKESFGAVPRAIRAWRVRRNVGLFGG